MPTPKRWTLTATVIVIAGLALGVISTVEKQYLVAGVFVAIVAIFAAVWSLIIKDSTK